MSWNIHYNGNGNTGGNAPVDPNSPYPNNATVTILGSNTLTRTDHYFAGWHQSPIATNPEYLPGQTLTITSTVQLFAVWKLNTGPTYTVTYNGNGHTGGSAPTDNNSPYVDNDPVIVQGPGSLVKDGYNFLGWNTDQNATTAQYTANQTFNINKNTILYAIWQQKSIPNTPQIIDEFSTFPSHSLMQILTHFPQSNNTSALGASFIGNGLAVIEAQFYVIRYGASVSASFVAEIYAHSGVFGNSASRPTGIPLAVSEPVMFNEATSNDWCSFFFTGQNQFLTVPGTHYFVVIKCITSGLSNSPNTNPYLAVRRGDVSGTNNYNGGITVVYRLNDWVNSTNLVAFVVWGISTQKTVTYYGNGHTGGSVPVDGNSPYALNSTVIVLSAGSLVKANYTFSHWNTKADGTGTSYNPNATFTITDDTELHAIWQENPKYTVIYHGNGHTSGSVPVDTNSPYYVGSQVTILSQGSLQKLNHTFGGWSRNSDGSGFISQPTWTFNITENIDYYAVWNENPKYTLSYDGNGHTSGSVPASQTDYVNTTISVASPGTLVKTNYTFQNWNTEANGSGTAYAVGANFTLITNVKLFAQWKENPKYTLSFDGNGHTGGAVPNSQTEYVNATVTVPNQGSLVKANNTFSHWNTLANGTGTSYIVGSTFTFTANTVLYAVWNENPKYTLSYDGNGNTGGSAPVSRTEYVGTVVVVAGPGDLAKTDHTFTKWNTQPNGSGTDYSQGNSITLNSNVKLYAQWTNVPTYTVTYLPGLYGTFAQQVTGGLFFGDPTPTPPVVTGQPGYSFSHWNPSPSATVTGNATYTAQWTQDKYTVIYAPGSQGIFTQQTNSNLVYGDPTPAAPTVTGNLGYTFTGWSPVPTSTVTGNVTYVAQWTQDKYTVTYAPGSQGTFTPQVTTNLIYGDPTPTPPTPTGNLGYTFNSWSPSPQASVTGNATYTAQWTQDQYTVRYQPGTHGAFTEQVTTGLTYGTTTPTPPTPTPQPGYSFSNWNPVPAATVTGNATYIAQWTQLKYTVRYEPGLYGTFTAQETINLVYGDPTPVPPMITSVGGWVFDTWQPTWSATVTGSVTYVAQWKQETYTVTYHPGDFGTFTPQVTSGLIFGDPTPQPPTPTGMQGYIFNHWTPVPVATVTGNMIYTAVWDIILYSLYYDGNGGTGIPPEDNTPYSVTNQYATVKGSGSLQRAKYDFDGWSLNPSDLKGVYRQGDQLQIVKDTVLYAIWVAQDMVTKPNDGRWIWEEIRRAKESAGIMPGKNPYDP